jgi:hypothetical protein
MVEFVPPPSVISQVTLMFVFILLRRGDIVSIPSDYLQKFNVFHVRALYYTENTNHQQMHIEFLYCTELHKLCSTSRDHKEFTPPKAAQFTVNSTFSINYIVQPSVTAAENFSLKMTQQGRNM